MRLNPKVITAYRSNGRAVGRLAGKALKEIMRLTCRDELLNMDVSSGSTTIA